MNLNINTCTSPIADTYLEVFSLTRKLLFFNDNYSGVGACNNTQSTCINIPMPVSGIYYVVTDGVNSDNVTTSLTRIVVTNPEDIFETTIDLGDT